jgi:hypothetical protein
MYLVKMLVSLRRCYYAKRQDRGSMRRTMYCLSKAVDADTTMPMQSQLQQVRVHKKVVGFSKAVVPCSGIAL